MARLFLKDGEIYKNINLPKTFETLPERAQIIAKYYIKPPKWPKTIKNLPKRRNFAKSGHTGSYSPHLSLSLTCIYIFYLLKHSQSVFLAHFPFYQNPSSSLHSVTRLGNFWKFLVTYFSYKVVQICFDFLGYFDKHPFEVKTAVATF